MKFQFFNPDGEERPLEIPLLRMRDGHACDTSTVMRPSPKCFSDVIGNFGRTAMEDAMHQIVYAPTGSAVSSILDGVGEKTTQILRLLKSVEMHLEYSTPAGSISVAQDHLQRAIKILLS